MKRGAVVGIIAIAGLAALVASRARRPEPHSPAGAPPAVEAQLDKVLPEVAFARVTFTEAVETLARQCGVDIVVDRAALAQKGFDCATEIDFRLRDVTARQALDALVGYASSSSQRACYALSGNRVVVTHGNELGKYAYVRVYDVRGIDIEPRPPTPPDVMSQLCFPDPVYRSERESLDEEFRWLIQDIVEGEWVWDGETVEAVERVPPGRLIVLTTSETHRAIQRVLDDLRRPPLRTVP